MEYGQTYYYIYPDGRIAGATWLDDQMDEGIYNYNNVIETYEEALLERDRRALVAKVHRFRDNCNSIEKPLDWKRFNQEKYFISYDSSSGDLVVSSSRIMNDFNLFGYFATHDGADAAIKIYGGQIKRLFCGGGLNA